MATEGFDHCSAAHLEIPMCLVAWYEASKMLSLSIPAHQMQEPFLGLLRDAWWMVGRATNRCKACHECHYCSSQVRTWGATCKFWRIFHSVSMWTLTAGPPVWCLIEAKAAWTKYLSTVMFGSRHVRQPSLGGKQVVNEHGTKSPAKDAKWCWRRQIHALSFGLTQVFTALLHAPPCCNRSES